MDENQQCIGVWGGGVAVERWQQPPMFQVFDIIIIIITSSNHRLESAGLNALEELLFKMLGMVGEDI